MTKDVIVEEGDSYWDKVRDDYGLEDFLVTHTNASEDTFLVITSAGDWYVWAAIISSLTLASDDKTALVRVREPEPDSSAASLAITHLDCGVSLADL